ncbi:NYN domain-containing protein [Solimonas sp. SE-A11]|nr:NYN domain-containing protein [Solimonas sp. SE-A11]
MAENPARIALLIDADNAPAAKIDVILAELAKYGVANIRRAYGNWTKPGLKKWADQLHEYAIRPVQQFDLTKGKNATDVSIVIDAMDLLYTSQLQAFAIVSSDCDFTPLVMRIRERGLEVYGFGEKKTPEPFVAACSKFLYLENLGEDSNVADADAPKAVPAKKNTTQLRQDNKLVALLRNAVEAAAGDDGWAHQGRAGSVLKNQGSFDPRNYGYRYLGDLIEASGLFDLERRGNNDVWLRDKRAAKATKPAAPSAATSRTSASPAVQKQKPSTEPPSSDA